MGRGVKEGVRERLMEGGWQGERNEGLDGPVKMEEGVRAG
jgi:hypothetical protein